ncbi:LuxR C-terminal-related transcriptional regulator [Actinomadura scrupuli]|uniref:LuxR C-terminal-related transcriptional regulator n=1 Tax=Actinomadura scrupuli TaxID=559629 RepID=UPI003D98E4A9
MTSNAMGTTHWPLVARGPHLDRIARALHGRQGRGLLIAGPPGAGRTRLTAEVRPALRVVGTRCAARQPLSAFAGWLSPGAPPTTKQVRAALRRGPAPVLVVDDAHLLDDASAALVHQLALHREVRVVATVVDGAPAPDAITALWKDDLLGRLPLAPLTEPELAELLGAVLDGPVEYRAVRRLAATVRGDLRMLGELVRAGILVQRGGLWTWRGLDTVDGRIRELVASRCGDLDGPAWDALAHAAFAAAGPAGTPLPVETLAALAGAEAVELLETRGLLAPDGTIPYAVIIRAMTGRLRARRIQRRLARCIDDPLRAAVWRLDCGDPVAPDLLIAAADRALAGHEVPLALRLGRTALSAGGGAPAAAVITAATRHTSLLDEEAARLEAALEAGDLTVAAVIGADTGWDEAAAAYCGHQARLARLRGLPRTALRWARDGALRRPIPLCMGELAHAAALLGDPATAHQALAEVDAGALVPAAGPLGECGAGAVGLARVWLLAAAGDREGTVGAALAVRGRARLFALHDVVRLGMPERVAPELERLSGAYAALVARQAAAGIAHDGTALEVVAKEFEHLGYLLYAAEAYAQAAAEHVRTGEPRRARAALNQGWRLGRVCEGACTPALTALAAPDLTQRQREIARLAVAGLGNREIANRLTVSIRTVANHLYAIYDRLGVHDRAGLAQLFAGLETE